MLKKIAALFAAALFAVSSFAAVDANKGTAAELDGLKGVGPAMSKRIVDARAQGEFKDWADFMQRVKGVKDKSATKLSGEGMTINGASYTPAAMGEAKKGKKGASETAAAPVAPVATTAAAPAVAVPAAKPAVAPAAAPAVAAVAPAAAPAMKDAVKDAAKSPTNK